MRRLCPRWASSARSPGCTCITCAPLMLVTQPTALHVSSPSRSVRQWHTVRPTHATSLGPASHRTTPCNGYVHPEPSPSSYCMGPAMSIWTPNTRSPVRLPCYFRCCHHPPYCCLSIIPTMCPGHSHCPLCNTPQKQVAYRSCASPNLV